MTIRIEGIGKACDTSRGFVPSRWLAAFLIVVAAIAFLSVTPARAQSEARSGTPDGTATRDYRLAPGDVVRVRVPDRKELTVDAAPVQADGTISLPSLGAVEVEGLSLRESRERIAEQLRERLGFSEPTVAVEVTNYRPVFVVGDVAEPGSFSFVPGLTVLQAIAEAGGFYRGEADDTSVRLEKGRLRERLGQYRERAARARARLARLTAEREDEAMRDPAPRYVGEDRMAQLVGLERDLLENRKEAYEGTRAILVALVEGFRAEIETLGRQREAVEEQIALAREEADAVASLDGRNLVPLTRRIAVRRAVLELNSEILEIDAFIARARSGLGRAERDALNLQTERGLEIRNSIKETSDDLAELEGLIDASLEQLGMIDRLAGRLGASMPDNRQALPLEAEIGPDDFAIIRSEGGRARAFEATLFDRLQPEDVVYVPVREPERARSVSREAEAN